MSRRRSAGLQSPEQGGVSTADREAVFLWSQEDAGSRGWPVGILQDGWPASQLSETRQRGAKIEGFFFLQFLMLLSSFVFLLNILNKKEV